MANEKQNKIEKIIEYFNKAEINISHKMAEKFECLTEFMLEYNEKVNLTAIKDFDDIIIKHYIDSVLPIKLTEIPLNSSIIDVGTGAGFPSIPMMIYRSDLNFTLCDSLNKRCTYLKLACEKLGLNPEIIHSRSEDLGRKTREKFDFSIARAVASMPVLSEYCIPFVKVGGKFIAMKSVNEEIGAAENSIKLLGGKVENNITYTLPNGDNRLLVLVKKISQTPPKYPRPSSVIAKKPL